MCGPQEWSPRVGSKDDQGDRDTTRELKKSLQHKTNPLQMIDFNDLNLNKKRSDCNCWYFMYFLFNLLVWFLSTRGRRSYISEAGETQLQPVVTRRIWVTPSAPLTPSSLCIYVSICLFVCPPAPSVSQGLHEYVKRCPPDRPYLASSCHMIGSNSHVIPRKNTRGRRLC